MSDEPTCGKGLAEHSTLPAKLAELATAMAEVLAVHKTSLDPGDPNARPEYDAYSTLVDDYRRVANTLGEIAERMAGYRDLPMAPHDEAVLAGPAGMESFAAYVHAERDVRDLLQKWVERDEAMLAEMDGN